MDFRGPDIHENGLVRTKKSRFAFAFWGSYFTFRQHRMLSGKIILINGASSSGKSTIARAVQKQLDEPFWHLSIDHLRESGVLPLDRVRAGDFVWKSMRPAFFQGFH